MFSRVHTVLSGMLDRRDGIVSDGLPLGCRQTHLRPPCVVSLSQLAAWMGGMRGDVQHNHVVRQAVHLDALSPLVSHRQLHQALVVRNRLHSRILSWRCILLTVPMQTHGFCVVFGYRA